MKKTDPKNRQERWAQGENTMRLRKETIEWQDDSTNLSRKEQMVVSRPRKEYTRATHRHVIEKLPSQECPFCGVSLTTEHILWKCTETTREREREKRNRNHERDMDRWNRRTEKTDRMYEENRIIPWNMNKDYVWKITRN
jgi:DNA repair exonuclease SbcCD ATPase subunit